MAPVRPVVACAPISGPPSAAGQRERNLPTMRSPTSVSTSHMPEAWAAARAELVATDCPGCIMQLQDNINHANGTQRPVHILELLDQLRQQGRLKMSSKTPERLTFHDPCQVSRRGGATGAARNVLKHLGVDFREMEYGGDYNWCCGGGGGVVTIKRAGPLRRRVFKLKMDQVEKTEADELLSSCANCRQSFDDSQEYFNWDYKMGSLMEMVAENLEEGQS